MVPGIFCLKGSSPVLQKIGNSRDRAVKKTGEGLLQLLRGEGALGLRPAVRAPRQQADAGGPVEGVVRPGRDPLKVVTGGHSAGQKGVPPQVDGVAAEQDGGLLAGDGAVRDKKCAAGAPHDPKIIGPGYSRGTGGVGIHIGERAVGIVGDSTRAGPNWARVTGDWAAAAAGSSRVRSRSAGMSCLMAYPPLGIAYHILEEYAVELRSDDIVFVNHGTLHRIEHLPLAVQGLSGVERVSWKPLRGTPEKQPAAVGRDLRRMGPPIAGAGDADGLNGRVGAEAKKRS